MSSKKESFWKQLNLSLTKEEYDAEVEKINAEVDNHWLDFENLLGNNKEQERKEYEKDFNSNGFS